MSDSTEDAYYDPALFGIMGALALMFIIMCVVLQLFARCVLVICIKDTRNKRRMAQKPKILSPCYATPPIPPMAGNSNI